MTGVLGFSVHTLIEQQHRNTCTTGRSFILNIEIYSVQRRKERTVKLECSSSAFQPREHKNCFNVATVYTSLLTVAIMLSRPLAQPLNRIFWREFQIHLFLCRHDYRCFARTLLSSVRESQFTRFSSVMIRIPTDDSFPANSERHPQSPPSTARYYGAVASL